LAYGTLGFDFPFQPLGSSGVAMRRKLDTGLGEKFKEGRRDSPFY